uniref:OTU domain-containing protein n=1 Tax=Rhabditophanes sp. KR3021 TaxID=114890 RepID=A0AC35TME5_9BILA
MTIIDENETPIQALKARHGREKKDLQAQVTKLKNLAKNDKKKKKDLLAEVEKMEKELKSRHEKELLEIGHNEDAKQRLEEEKIVKAELEKVKKAQEKTRNKHEKYQEKKEEFNRTMAKKAEEQAIYDLTSKKTLELAEINQKLAPLNLELFEIAADGDCLYNALAHQLQQHGRSDTGSSLRKMAADCIVQNKEYFFPYLGVEDTGFDKYIFETANSAISGGRWGGHPELVAISDFLKKRIEVIQSEMEKVVIGEKYPLPSLILTYHTNAFLGEHYNSTIAARPHAPDDTF